MNSTELKKIIIIIIKTVLTVQHKDRKILFWPQNPMISTASLLLFNLFPPSLTQWKLQVLSSFLLSIKIFFSRTEWKSHENMNVFFLHFWKGLTQTYLFWSVLLINFILLYKRIQFSTVQYNCDEKFIASLSVFCFGKSSYSLRALRKGHFILLAKLGATRLYWNGL